MNFENMWSVNHGHTDLMYVFAPHIHLRGRMNCFPVSGSSPFPLWLLSCLPSYGLTSSARITISRKDPWLGESQRHVLTSYPVRYALTRNRPRRRTKASERLVATQQLNQILLYILCSRLPMAGTIFTYPHGLKQHPDFLDFL
jgi:hypothetical protein